MKNKWFYLVGFVVFVVMATSFFFVSGWLIAVLAAAILTLSFLSIVVAGISHFGRPHVVQRGHSHVSGQPFPVKIPASRFGAVVTGYALGAVLSWLGAGIWIFAALYTG